MASDLSNDFDCSQVIYQVFVENPDHRSKRRLEMLVSF